MTAEAGRTWGPCLVLKDSAQCAVTTSGVWSKWDGVGRVECVGERGLCGVCVGCVECVGTVWGVCGPCGVYRGPVACVGTVWVVWGP